MSKFARTAILILGLLLIWQAFNPKENGISSDDIILKTDSEIAIGNDVIVEIQNNRETAVTFPSNCPQNPLRVEQYLNGEWGKISGETSGVCEVANITIEPGESYMLSYAPWNADLFNEKGKYRVSLDLSLEEKEKSYTTEVTVGSPGLFRKIGRELFYKPILNTLIFLIAKLPAKDLGWGIILLTILVKLLLLAPNHKALKAQKQMQKVQPQLDALKLKYKDNPQKLAEETMKIWQKHKVNPMSSCLPMLIQFPVLIALFYVVKDGLQHINPELLYASLKNFDPSLINPNFLGMIDLTKVNILMLPITIGLLQFAHMKITLGKAAASQDPKSPMPMMNKTMLYVMPVMITVFTASLPAAVGFYWGTSTLFGIGQQIAVNRND
ncbi:MAG: YidC/Oxa1 family membrane protein insertase [Candidatus Peregrinibacteria bacterium]|nr:YidC/Oxa1 family membrane protein insertase [Candidatus Peregrinibacteria bacterium]